MSVIEKKEVIAANYRCNDIHAETCVDTCATCERYLRDDLDELEKEIRADERAKTIRLLNDGSYLFDTDEWGEPLGRNDEFFLKELEYLETLTDDFDKYVDSQLV